jgi:hypothetical protein
MSRRFLDPVSLAFGVIFLAVGGFLVAGQADLLVRLRWAWPVVLIVVAVGLLAWLGADSHRRGRVGGPRP